MRSQVTPSLLALIPIAVAVGGCTAYQIPSVAMEPTLLPGDYFITVALAEPPSRGQIVTYRAHGVTYVKRVVGLGGDTILMREGELFINGQSLSEPYTVRQAGHGVVDSAFSWQRQFLVGQGRTQPYHPTSTSWGPLLIPDSSYFILGDNRPESADSRYTGFVAADMVFGRPVLIYFSYDHDVGAVRWRRIGTWIKSKP
jgi:signal peptidase I